MDRERLRLQLLRLTPLEKVQVGVRTQGVDTDIVALLDSASEWSLDHLFVVEQDPGVIALFDMGDVVSTVNTGAFVADKAGAGVRGG